MTKTVNSLAALGEAWNEIHDGKRNQVRLDRRQKAEKPRKCRICGTVMMNIPNTNVWICTGMKTVLDPTEENPEHTKQEPCTNQILSK